MNLQTAIVEDSKPDAERLKQLLKKAFENENISCSCFASGDEFLRAGWREGYQVVFLDICMEGTNGIETAQRLRAADRPGRHGERPAARTWDRGYRPAPSMGRAFD